MKKNIMTIVLIALAVVNLTLTAVLVFAVVPAATESRKLITKVAQCIDLELESQTPEKELGVEDMDVYTVADQLTVNLAKEAGDTKAHYAVFTLSVTLNKTSEDYSAKKELLASYDTFIKEIVTEEFGKFTINNVNNSKEKIKEEIVAQLNTLLETKCIVSVSFGNIVCQ